MLEISQPDDKLSVTIDRGHATLAFLWPMMKCHVASSSKCNYIYRARHRPDKIDQQHVIQSRMAILATTHNIVSCHVFKMFFFSS